MTQTCERCDGNGIIGRSVKGGREAPGPVPEETKNWYDNLPKGPTGITLLLDTTVYAPKHLDEVGRCECCRRNPLAEAGRGGGVDVP